jgi:hypothetical protein
MIHRAHAAAAKLEKDGTISARTRQCIQQLLAEDYGSEAIARMPDYASQATRLNSRLWQRLHGHATKAPRLVSLELEKVSARLVLMDIHSSRSLTARVLFETPLRSRVFEALDGHRACWQNSAIPFNARGTTPAPAAPRRGTHFFWGVSDKGRKFPLAVAREDDGKMIMHGVDAKGNRLAFPLHPEPIEKMIRQNRIVPSVFTCFLTLAFARGVNCLGGYYQAAYLPSMQSGLVKALSGSPTDRDMADTIRRIPTAGYLSGMQTVMIRQGQERLVPAGPIEIIAEKGLTDLDTEKILGMTVEDAHLASLFETIPDIAPEMMTSAAWKDEIARDCFETLRGRVIVK